MGFGSLFIGYFFLINISYFEYTDIISAMVMLIGLYSLSKFNRGFKTAFIFNIVFALLAFAEIIVTVLNLFGIALFDAVELFSIPRYALIFGVTASFLFGIKDVAREVEAYEISSKAGKTLPFTAIYPIMAICDIPAIGFLLGPAKQYIYLVLIISHLILVAVTLVTVYRAYATICMPEDLHPEVKKSRFEFVNRFREHEEKKNREYADYKIRKGLDAEKKKEKKKKSK